MVQVNNNHATTILTTRMEVEIHLLRLTSVTMSVTVAVVIVTAAVVVAITTMPAAITMEAIAVVIISNVMAIIVLEVAVSLAAQWLLQIPINASKHHPSMLSLSSKSIRGRKRRKREEFSTFFCLLPFSSTLLSNSLSLSYS